MEYRRFELLRPELEAEFTALCEKKKLTRDDLILILKVIRINPDIYPL